MKRILFQTFLALTFGLHTSSTYTINPNETPFAINDLSTMLLDKVTIKIEGALYELNAQSGIFVQAKKGGESIDTLMSKPPILANLLKENKIIFEPTDPSLNPRVTLSLESGVVESIVFYLTNSPAGDYYAKLNMSLLIKNLQNPTWKTNVLGQHLVGSYVIKDTSALWQTRDLAKQNPFYQNKQFLLFGNMPVSITLNISFDYSEVHIDSLEIIYQVVGSYSVYTQKQVLSNNFLIQQELLHEYYTPPTSM